jgi:hypothetical protein
LRLNKLKVALICLSKSYINTKTTAHASICAGGRIMLSSPYRYALESRSSYQSLVDSNRGAYVFIVDDSPSFVD